MPSGGDKFCHKIVTKCAPTDLYLLERASPLNHQGRNFAADFLGLLRPIQRDLENYARRMVFDSCDFEDALQNAVSRAFRAFDRYHDNGSFRAWMFKILTNEIFALNRKRGRIAHFEIGIEPQEIDELTEAEFDKAWSTSPTTWDSLADALDDELLTALQDLNDLERAVLFMRAIGELPYREISECLGIPLGSVMGYLSRARQKIREVILRSHRRSPL